MASINSKSLTLSVNSDNISAYTNSVEISSETSTHDVTGFGSDAKAFTPGLNEATMTTEGWYDTTASGGTADVLDTIYAGNAAVAVQYRPEGAGTGLPNWAFDAVLTSYSLSHAVDDIVMWSADWQITGDVTKTNQS
jgi:hypothetical protein